jgi:membrane-associated protease RseP (regulator of RpoE activity)
MKRMLLILVVFVVILSQIAFAQQEKTQTQQKTKLKFELISNIIFVDAYIDGKGPLKFIFDTGASISVLAPATARKLKIKGKTIGGIFGMGGVRIARVKKLKVKDIEIENFQFAILTVWQAEMGLKMLGVEYHGILGFNFISRFKTTIDYKNKIIELEPTGFEPPDFIQQQKELMKKIGIGRKWTKQKGYMGITYKPLKPKEAKKLGIEGGIRIVKLKKGGPADKAGFKEGDIITAIGRVKIKTGKDLHKALWRYGAGKRVRVKIIREGEKKKIKIRLGRRK